MSGGRARKVGVAAGAVLALALGAMAFGANRDGDKTSLVWPALIGVLIVGASMAFGFWESNRSITGSNRGMVRVARGFAAIARRKGLIIEEPPAYDLGDQSLMGYPTLRGTYRGYVIRVGVNWRVDRYDQFEVMVRPPSRNHWPKLGRIDRGRPIPQLSPDGTAALERLSARKKGREVEKIVVKPDELLCYADDRITSAVHLDDPGPAPPLPTELESILDDLVTLAGALPKSPVKDAPRGTAARAPDISRPGQSSPAALAGQLDVVLIDSDADCARTISESLARHGLRVATRRQDQALVPFLRASPPRLVIASAESGGFTLCNQLKRDRQFGGVRLVITVGAELSAESMRHARLKTCADAYFRRTEPSDIEPLLRNVESLLASPTSVARRSWG